MSLKKVVEILLIEDNEPDADLMKFSLKQANVKSKLNHVLDGAEAIKYLKKQGQYETVARPDLILLDINLPIRSGLEVLKIIKTDEDLRSIPVTILTTSENADDIHKSYEYHANSYIVKPDKLDEFTKMVSSFENFWLKTATLPEE